MELLDEKVSRNDTLSRKSQISKVKYNLLFHFSLDSNEFQVETKIKFHFDAANGLETFLDCKDLSIQSLSINKNEHPSDIFTLNKQERDQRSEKLLLSNLSPGVNSLKIISVGKFSQDGNGLSKHNEKDNIFIYTLFVTNYAKNAFPCFDQPDLKAKFTISIICPKKWGCFSNESCLEGFPHSIEKGVRLWKFQETKLLPTYLVALAAGNFTISEQKFEDTTITLIAKPSSGYLLFNDYNSLAEMVHQCIKCYEKLFHMKIPFENLKFIFCPEFNFYGMEHPGLIYLSEGYLYWEKSSVNKRTTRALTVVHEIAHMWFGNLATMKWWEDIWLNESFAVFISHLVLEELDIPGLENIMLSNLIYKQYGYERDILDNSHPVRQTVNFPEESNDIFDSITYSKGASVLKQLYFISGKEKFSFAMKKYFEKFAWENADSDEFFQIFQAELRDTEVDLQKWKEDWIDTSSYNFLSYSLIKEENGGQFIELEQFPANKKFPVLRDHYFLIYVCSENSHNYTILKAVISHLNPKTRIEIPNNFFINPQNYAILLNYNDHSYFKGNLDSNSLTFFMKNFSTFKDIMLKGLILTTLFDCVYSFDFNVKDFLDFLYCSLRIEENLQIFHQILTISNNLIENFLFKENSFEFCSKTFDYLYKELQECQGEKLLVINEFLYSFAYDLPSKMKLIDWILNKNVDLISIPYNSTLLTFTIETIFLDNLLDEQEKMEIKQRFLLKNKYYMNFCKYAEMEFEEKLAEWENFVGCTEENNSYYLTAYKMKGFNNNYDLESQKFFEKKFFEVIEKIFSTHPIAYATVFFQRLFPKTTNIDFHISKLEKILDLDTCINSQPFSSLVIKKLYLLNHSQKMNSSFTI